MTTPNPRTLLTGTTPGPWEAEPCLNSPPTPTRSRPTMVKETTTEDALNRVADEIFALGETSARVTQTREARSLSGADVGREILLESGWRTIKDVEHRGGFVIVGTPDDFPGWRPLLDRDDLVTVRDVE